MALIESPTAHRQGTLVVVDQNDVVRHGYESLLEHHPRVEWVVGLTIEQALAASGWSDVRWVVIDPVDERRTDDQLPGVEVVEHIRSSTIGELAPRVLVVSDRDDDDALRRRMLEAGADGYCRRSEIREVASLWTIALRDEFDGIPAPQDREALHRLGVTSRSRVNDGLRAALAQRLVPGAGWVGPDTPDQRERRQRFNLDAQLTPLGPDGTPADDHDDVPSLAQVQAFASWAATSGRR